MQAQENALRQFLGPGRGLPGSGVHYDWKGGAAFRLSAEQTLVQHGDVTWVGRLTAEVGQGRYRFPEGIGPFLDPMDVRLRHGALTPELGARAVLWRGLGLALEMDASAGMVFLQSEGRYRSALIKLDRNEHFRDAFVATALRVGRATGRGPQNEIGLRMSAQAGLSGHWALVARF
jgi:hypothetical protein